jgi:hypothetical protein
MYHTIVFCSSFVWPPDATEQQRRNMMIKAAQFAGCTVPNFSDTKGEEACQTP